MTDNETKIVKASKANDSNKDENASKVQIQAVDIAIIQAQKERAAKKKAAAAKNSEKKEKTAAGAKPPVGKPMTKSSAPIGKPMPKNSSAGSQTKSTPAGRPMTSIFFSESRSMQSSFSRTLTTASERMSDRSESSADTPWDEIVAIATPLTPIFPQ